MKYNPPTQSVRDTFHQGTSRRAYEMLGAHPCHEENGMKWHFCVWASTPRRFRSRVVLTAGIPTKTPCKSSTTVPGNFACLKKSLWRDVPADGYPVYKYAIMGADGKLRLKADPCGFFAELRPDMGSRLYDLDGYLWQDRAWMEKRSTFNPYMSPINIYEVHLGFLAEARRRKFAFVPEFAEQIIPYVTEMGYTHIELLPVMEHPLDMSWGYQVLGFYAATSRFGTPKELMELIDRCHQAGIGVSLDWVPAHFPRDEAGLFRLDGTPLYSHPDPKRGEIPQWGTMLFDFGRGEVCSYLLSDACFWLDVFHVDGLRVDAVSGLLYYDFCKEQGEWLPNEYGGRRISTPSASCAA